MPVRLNGRPYVIDNRSGYVCEGYMTAESSSRLHRIEKLPQLEQDNERMRCALGLCLAYLEGVGTQTKANVEEAIIEALGGAK